MTLDPIKLVRGQARPFVIVTLKDSAGVAVDLSDPTTLVSMRFRSVGSENTLQTVSCEKVDGGVTGKVQFAQSGSMLTVDPGWYEGEFAVSFNGTAHRVYERLKIFIRQQFD